MNTLSEGVRVSLPTSPPTLYLGLPVGPRNQRFTNQYKRQLQYTCHIYSVALDLQLWYILETSIMNTLSEDGRVSRPT